MRFATLTPHRAHRGEIWACLEFIGTANFCYSPCAKAMLGKLKTNRLKLLCWSFLMGTWNDSLKIGVTLVDLQHKQLLDQMDLLLESIKTKKDSKQILNVLKFLDMYVANHFGYEEQCMHINRCPMASQNKTAHAYFVSRLKEIKTNLISPKSLDAVASGITNELLNWFVNHIRGIDTHLGPCVK